VPFLSPTDGSHEQKKTNGRVELSPDASNVDQDRKQADYYTPHELNADYTNNPQELNADNNGRQELNGDQTMRRELPA
jgi:hypothetical protein